MLTTAIVLGIAGAVFALGYGIYKGWAWFSIQTGMMNVGMVGPCLVAVAYGLSNDGGLATAFIIGGTIFGLIIGFNAKGYLQGADEQMLEEEVEKLRRNGGE